MWRPPRRPLRLSVLFLAFVLAVAVAGVALLQLAGRREVVAASGGLPAYRVIEERDLRKMSVSRAKASSAAVTTADAVTGRYLLRPLKQDDPVLDDDLGPRIAELGSGKLALVAIPVTPAATFDGRLRRGSRISLLLSPRDARSASRRLTEVLVIDVPPSSKGILVVGFQAAERDTYARYAATSKVLVEWSPQ